jgi:hypothetical protein
VGDIGPGEGTTGKEQGEGGGCIGASEGTDVDAIIFQKSSYLSGKK